MKFNTLTSKQVQTNLRAVYNKIEPSWHAEGLNWYKKAHEFALFYSEQYNISIATASALIAVLSPQKSWYQNLLITQEFLETKGNRVRHYKMQVDKARAIYHLNSLYKNADEYLTGIEELYIKYIDNVLHGSKTINFFHNILEPENSDYVTIDSHMIQLMTGNMKCKYVTAGQYEFLKKELIKFAAKHNTSAPTMQAKLWVTFRIIKKY
jgi:hypothetical protein